MLALASVFVCQGPAYSQERSAVEQRSAASAEDRATIAYKLTTALYRTTHQPDAYDVNLRGSVADHAAWLGFYKRANEFQQLRAGYSDTISMPFVTVVPSLEYASRGFLGGSVNAQIGERHFGLFGVGRTNLKDYFNLTFDPGDSFLVGAGTGALRNTVVSVFQIRDYRLGTGQRVLHIVARIKPDASTRWTVDLFYKEGRGAADDEVKLYGTGASVTYDFERYFVRMAFDPHVNFTPDNMVRLSVGMRF